MELYPSIERQIRNETIYAFDKIDGSNIRAEWSKKAGFTKFGTRKRLLDPSEPVLGEAVELIMHKYSDYLSKIFRKERLERATAFFEFAGEHSFAGQHEDEPHDVILFDVHVYKQGIMTPRDFIKTFDNKVEIAPVLYHGKPNQDFVRSVKEGTLPGMTFEGVVCKGGLDNRRRVVSFKVKNQAWLNRLKEKCGDDEKMYEMLR
jgi:RNA ligase